MAKITSAADLTYIVNGTPASEMLRIDTSTPSAPTIELVAGGALVALDGVTGLAVFTRLKTIWKDNATAPKYPFPMKQIHDESFELVDGWNWKNDTTRKMVRDCGWAVRNAAKAITEMWAGIGSLGTVVTGAPYYSYSSATNATTSAFTHVKLSDTFCINEAVQILSDPNGDGSYVDGFDRRTYFKMFLREAGYTYDESSNTDIGYASLTYKKYNFPITHAVDSNIIANDATVDANAPYTSMTATWYAAAQSASLGTNGPYNFHTIIAGASATDQQIYTWVQRQLRKATDIDADVTGNRTGKVTPLLMRYDSGVLTTIYQSTGGVHISSPSAASLNNINEYDDTNTLRNYPYTASLTIEFDEYLQADAGPAEYWVWFENDDAATTPLGYDYGTNNAILVKDASDNDMTGNVSGASVTLTYDFDGNAQRGAGSAGDNAPVVVVAIGLATAKFASARTTITRSTTNKAVLVAGQELNTAA